MENGGGNDRLGMMILSEIAEQDDINPEEVSPTLYPAIDTDALESLFFDPSNGPVKVEFSYAGHLFMIHGDEHVQVTVE